MGFQMAGKNLPQMTSKGRRSRSNLKCLKSNIAKTVRDEGKVSIEVR